MRFTSIWFPGYPMALKEKIDRTKDLWSMNVDSILPKRVRYWVALREIAKATTTSQNIPATTLDNILTNLGNVKDGNPLEQFEWDESMLNKEDDHSEHVHVAPLNIDKMTPEERENLAPAVQSLLAVLADGDKKENDNV